MIVRSFLMVLALMIMPFTVQAADVGDVIPHQIELNDQDGQAQSFETLKGENGLVLVFLRSADWCPFCRVQLMDLQAWSESITSQGYNVVTVSYDSVEILERFTAKYGVSFEMLSDPDSAAIRAFGILNENVRSSSRSYGIPHPTVFVVDADGTIEHVLAEEGFRKRPSVKAIAAAISGD